MTVLVAKIGDPTENNMENEPIIPESNELGIDIPEKHEENIMSKETEKNDSEVEICDGNSKKWNILMLLVIWFLCLSINNVLFKVANWTMFITGKLMLGVIQVSSITVFSWLYYIFVHKAYDKNQPEISWLYYSRFIAPIALCMFARSLIDTRVTWLSPMGETSLLMIEVLLPFCTIVGSVIILESDIPLSRIFTMGIIGCSIYLFLWNSRPWFLGIKKSCMFAILIALEMVFSKKVMQEKRLQPLRFLIHIGLLYLCTLAPILGYQLTFFTNFYDIMRIFELYTPESIAALFIHGLMCWGQTAAIFSILSMTSPIEYCGASSIIHLLSVLLLYSFNILRPDGFFEIPYLM